MCTTDPLEISSKATILNMGDLKISPDFQDCRCKIPLKLIDFNINQAYKSDSSLKKYSQKFTIKFHKTFPLWLVMSFTSTYYYFICFFLFFKQISKSAKKKKINKNST